MLIFCTLLRLHYTETMWPHSIAMGGNMCKDACQHTLLSHFAVSRVHLLDRCAFAALHFTRLYTIYYHYCSIFGVLALLLLS